MGTTRSFQAMLNDFLPNKLLRNEMVKRDFLLKNVEKDDTWIGASGSSGNGGNLIVPFEGASASSVSAGGLTASNDIAQYQYVRGQISTQPEIWGSLIFNHRDLMEHETISEKNFLKILPQQIDFFLDYLRNVVSVNLFNGAHFAKTTAAASASSGVIVVDRVDRFILGQKIQFITSDSTTVTGYVTGIVINTLSVTVSTARTGGVAIDFSASGKDLASGAKIYNDGFITNGMSSLRDALLSSANGGSSTLYGQSKLAFPYLQALNMNGASITSSNLVEKLFGGYTLMRRLTPGRPTEIVMSYNNLGIVMSIVEASKGAFNVKADSKKTSQFGWTEITIGSVTNQELKFVGVQEMDDDIVIYMDWRGLKFYSNGFFRKRKSPDGIEYFEIRAQTGFQYIVDICLFGDLVVHMPSVMGIVYGVSLTYPLPNLL